MRKQRLLPDKRTQIGRYYVDLWCGIFKDEIRVWRDVRPALGGLIFRQKVWRSVTVECYERTVELVREHNDATK